MHDLLLLLGELPPPDTFGDPAAGQSGVPSLTTAQWIGWLTVLIGLVVHIVGIAMILATRSDLENEAGATSKYLGFHLLIHAVIHIDECWRALLLMASGIGIMLAGGALIRA